MLSNSVQKFIVIHPGILLLLAFLFIFFLFLIVCSDEPKLNYRILLVFSLSESYIIGFISAYSNPKVVFMVVLCIFVIVVTLALCSINTTTDVTIYGEILCIFLMTIILFVMFTIFTNYSFFKIIRLLLGAILACFYIICEIKIIFGNGDILTGEYIIPAFMIYTDIILLYTKLYDLFERLYSNF